MLALRIKSGEYITIDEDIAVQIFQRPGDSLEVSVKAPREVHVLRGSMLERSRSRPEGLRERRMKPPSEKKHGANRLQALAKQEERHAAAAKMDALLDELAQAGDCAEVQEMRRLLSRMI